MQKWEYWILQLQKGTMLANTSEGQLTHLSEIGSQGWELVTVTQAGEANPIAWFKREILARTNKN